MKNHIIILFICFPLIAKAAPVDPSLAQQVAENFINAPEANVDGLVNRTPRKQRRLARASQQVMNNQQFYIFNTEDADGFVIISADNVAIPVLGYSYSGTLDVNNIPDNMRWWLGEYNREIRWAIAQGIEPTDDTTEEWQELSNARKAQQAEVIVSPLIQTEWSQSPWYNNKCPYDSNAGKRCVTGCVATAMAQIMKYWEHPIIGRGSYAYESDYGVLSADFGNTTYDWANMPNDLGILSSNTQINAIATLMYHCGVSVHMNYGPSESSASSWWVASAFKDYFLYSDEARLCSKDDYTLSEFKSKLQVQLFLGRPLYYSGRGSSGGHAFICDGYRSDDYFHFNWGWDEQDGYYSLSALKPSFLFLTTADYTSDQNALLCLYPKTDTTAKFILEMEEPLSLCDSIPVGEPWFFTANISNVGEKKFEGHIYASVYNTVELGSGLHYRTDLIMTDSLRVDSLSWLGDFIDFNLDSARNLPAGVYQVVMQYRDSINGDLTPIRSDFYSNLTEIVVYNSLEMDLYAQFAWKGSREHWGVGDSIKFITQIDNNESTPFAGLLTIKLVNKSDTSINQFFDNTDCSKRPIPAKGDEIMSIVGKLTTTPGEYDVYLLYKKNESEEWKLVGCKEGFVNPMSLLVEPPVERNEYVILAQRKATANWYYLTSHNAGTEYTPHLEAVNSGTADKTKVQNFGLEYKYIWTIEETVGGVLVSGLDGYIAYNSGNTAYMNNSSGQVLSVNNLSNGLKQYWFVDSSSATRYLSLNTTKDYFSFYKGTQAQDLLVLKYTDAPVTSIDNIEPEQKGTIKLLRDGNVYILHGEKVYTLQGQEVK